MESDARSTFKQRFTTAFAWPAGDRQLKSKRGRAVWINLQTWQDSLAGPLHSISETGGCAYVYNREDEYFRGVDRPAALHDRLRDWHTELTSEIDRFVPQSSDESADIDTMLKYVADMWSVIETGCEIERNRWEKSII